MTEYIVKQYTSLADAFNALVSGVRVFAIDLDSFDKILEIEFHSFSELHNLSLGHNLVFIGLIKREDYYD